MHLYRRVWEQFQEWLMILLHPNKQRQEPRKSFNLFLECQKEMPPRSKYPLERKQPNLSKERPDPFFPFSAGEHQHLLLVLGQLEK